MSLKQDIYAKIHTKSRGVFLFLLCSLLILAFVLPTWVIPIPYGTDVYTHLFMTRILSSVNSLSQFYTYCFEEGYLTYDYPFGLWLFGSIVAKITGMDMLELSQILPFVVMLILITLYFSYARVFTSSGDEALLSVIFLLSIPLMCLDVLAYQTRTIVIPFLIFIIYFILTEDKISLWKRTLLINMFIFILCFTHTGTYMFLLTLTIAYLFIYAIFWGELHRDSYMTAGSMMFIYIITMHLFPHVHPQYIDKGRILVSAGDFLTSDLHMPLADELARMFYEQIFLELNLLYVVLACLAIYAACRFLVFLHHKIKTSGIKLKLSEKFLSVPIIGSIRHVSHSIISTPFWLGPVHTVLAILGVFRVNRKGLYMLFAVAAVTLLSGYMAGERAIREIEYFFVIIPVLAALGFYHARAKVEPHMHNKLQKFFVAILLLSVFFSIVVLPVVGNLYYHPLISGPEYERTGLSWLGGIGEPDEGCAGWGYRHMISIYGNKIPPAVTTVASGSEMSNFIQDQYSVCFNMNSEKHADDLYATFGVKYLIVSKRTIRNFGEKPEHLMIDHNRQLDKIYSSAGPFSIYKYITYPVHRANIAPKLNFADDALIKDAGDSYLVETDYYKMRIGKANPEIKYIGNKTTNFIGDGEYYDYLLITWGVGSLYRQFNDYILHEVSYPKVILGKNQIIYSTILKNQNGAENWATLTVKYTFFERAMKRDVIISNDRVEDTNMNAGISMAFYYTPMRYFRFRLDEKTPISRTIYPCQDKIRLEKLRFNKIFINNGKEGVYIKFENTAPYPSGITYSGLTTENAYLVIMSMRGSVSPSGSYHLSQWISIGDEQTAEKNIERYSSVSLYPYPDGEIPIIVVSRINSLNTSSEEDFNATLNGHVKLKEMGVAIYSEAVNMQDMEINTSRMKRLLEQGAYIIGYERVKGYNTTVQEYKIEKMVGNAQKCYKIDLKGFMPEDFRYNLSIVKILNEQNLTFIVSKEVLPAFDIYYQEGLRRPQMAYYHGEKTNLVLLPISGPEISRPFYVYGEDYEGAWKAVIDSVIENEDVCIFLWDSEKVNRAEYMTQVLNTIKYAIEKGMNFTTPYEIAKHFLLLQNISAVISKSDDGSKITISVSNGNEEPVRGVTFKMKVPNNEEYVVKKGQIARKTFSDNSCIYYLSTDLSSKETKEIVIQKC